ncbi:hypothetical protein HDU80_007831, partial (mitochondrion) [Chytriomyces hyalinus]
AIAQVKDGCKPEELHGLYREYCEVNRLIVASLAVFVRTFKEVAPEGMRARRLSGGKIYPVKPTSATFNYVAHCDLSNTGNLGSNTNSLVCLDTYGATTLKEALFVRVDDLPVIPVNPKDSDNLVDDDTLYRELTMYGSSFKVSPLEHMVAKNANKSVEA